MKYLLLTAALLAAPAASAHDYTLGDLSIGHPFAIETVGNAPVGGGYLTITNDGDAIDRLVAVRVDPDVAGTVQLHEMRMDGDVMRMGEVPDGIPIVPGETVTLAPGGLHVMFMDLGSGLEVGDDIPATLVFENAGEVEVVFAVEPRGTREEKDHDHTGHEGHGD